MPGPGCVRKEGEMTTKVTSSDHCGSPDELRKWVQKDRMGTHWVGCEKSHKDCAILKAADAWDLALVARYAIEEKYRALVKRLEEAERAIYDGRLYSAHFKAWADQIEIDQGYAGSEVACLLRRLAALAKEEKT